MTRTELAYRAERANKLANQARVDLARCNQVQDYTYAETYNREALRWRTKHAELSARLCELDGLYSEACTWQRLAAECKRERRKLYV